MKRKRESGLEEEEALHEALHKFDNLIESNETKLCITYPCNELTEEASFNILGKCLISKDECKELAKLLMHGKLITFNYSKRSGNKPTYAIYNMFTGTWEEKSEGGINEIVCLHIRNYFGHMYQYFEKLMEDPECPKIKHDQYTSYCKKVENLIDMFRNTKTNIGKKIRDDSLIFSKNFESLINNEDKDVIEIADYMILNLKTRTSRKREASDYYFEDMNYDNNNNMKINYKPEAKSKFLDDYLNHLFYGQSKVEERVRHLQTCLGYALTGHRDWKTIFVLFGAINCGKSTLYQMMELILGTEHFCHAEQEILVEKGIKIEKGASDHSSGLQRVVSKRMVVSDEIEDGSKWNVTMVKKLTGQDKVSTRGLYKEFQDQQINAKFFVIGNYIPLNFDGPLAERIVQIDFSGQYKSNRTEEDIEAGIKEVDTNVNNYINTNTEFQEAFLAWVVQGAMLSYQCKKCPVIYEEQEDEDGKLVRVNLNSSLTVPDKALDFRMFYEKFIEIDMTTIGKVVRKITMEDLKAKYTDFVGNDMNAYSKIKSGMESINIIHKLVRKPSGSYYSNCKFKQ